MGKVEKVQIGLWIRKLKVRVLPRQHSDQVNSAVKDMGEQVKDVGEKVKDAITK